MEALQIEKANTYLLYVSIQTEMNCCFSPNWKGFDVIDLLSTVWLTYLSNGAILGTNIGNFYYRWFGIFSSCSGGTHA